MTAQQQNTPAIAAAVAAFGLASFLKLDAEGKPLASDATEFAAVRVSLGAESFDMLRANVGDDEMTWADANAACAAIDAMGHRDWRLPTRPELLAIVDLARHGPAVDPVFFGDIEAEWYWTSTPAASSPADHAWLVTFGHGAADYLRQANAAFVRAVRSSSPASQ